MNLSTEITSMALNQYVMAATVYGIDVVVTASTKEGVREAFEDELSTLEALFDTPAQFLPVGALV